MLIEDFRAEYERYRGLGERAIAQIDDHALNALPAPESNSIAMIMRHVAGNFASRFTDFLSADGEKAWSDRDVEFEIREYDRADIVSKWKDGWRIVETQLAPLTEPDLTPTLPILRPTLPLP